MLVTHEAACLLKRIWNRFHEPFGTSQLCKGIACVPVILVHGCNKIAVVPRRLDCPVIVNIVHLVRGNCDDSSLYLSARQARLLQRAITTLDLRNDMPAVLADEHSDMGADYHSTRHVATAPIEVADVLLRDPIPDDVDARRPFSLVRLPAYLPLGALTAPARCSPFWLPTSANSASLGGLPAGFTIRFADLPTRPAQPIGQVLSCRCCHGLAAATRL